MDTMTLTKVTAALCGAFLVLLLGKWAAEAMYHTASHGEASYVIEVEGGDGGHEEVSQVSLEELMASADVGKGAKVFKKCAACHKLEDGVNATGPYLYGVVGRPVATAAGFGYSGAMSGKGGDWSVEALDTFLASPKGDVPGTSMGFSGLKKQSDRVNLIAHLESLDN
jgi:cytochrome c